MRNYMMIGASSLFLVACGGTDTSTTPSETEAPVTAPSAPNVSIDLTDTCALLSMDDLSAVFPGQDFVAKQGDVTTIGNSGSECIYELSEQGPGRYLTVTLGVTDWGNLTAAGDAFEFVADPSSDGFDPITGLGDQAGYVDFNALQEVMAIAGTYVISLAVTNPGVSEFDKKTPAMDLADRLAERL